MREIVTLQLGNFSNYVSTHFWNAQESYFTYSDEGNSLVDHDIHWRPGIGADGSDTFLPRTVIYDLKGGFGPLRKINPLYDVGAAGDINDDSLWSGKPAIHKQTPLELSDYQKSLNSGTKPQKPSSSSVRYWSDFSRVFYHPKSLVQLYDFEVHSTIMPFERFEMGTELFRSLEKDDEIVDRDWRPFVEECDQMQGIQIFTSLDDAWGGFASSYIEALRDEHPKSCIWVWGLQTPAIDITRETRRLRMANVAQSLHQICSQASMVVPLATPSRLPSGISLSTSSAWQTSALLTTAAESSLLQSRLNFDGKTQPVLLSELTQSLNVAGNQTLANMRMAVGPQAGGFENDLLDIDLSQVGFLRDQIAKDDSGRFFGRVSSLRGLDGDNEPTEIEEEDLNRRLIVGSAVRRSYTSPLKFPLLDSYPSIYTSTVEEDCMRVRTTISTDSSIAARMKQLRSQVVWAVGSDDRETLVNGLAEIGDAYQDEWSEGSDLDDDDDV
ncbi:Protein DML1 [Cladobotryum mycophilum]|uniref:Protein DML1 n=1 Tax=Cladobotryum mycophilum TaxID=491253 RepID=A0ABR0SAE9_9HYPO